MKNYLAASAAYGACLNRQVTLGASLVAATDRLLNDQSKTERNDTMIRARELREQFRLNKLELSRLRRILKRAIMRRKLSLEN